jgi:hypothetical protein
VPKLDAAPADAPKIIAPIKICAIPRQKTKTLFQNEGFFFFFLLAFGNKTSPSAARFSLAFSKSFYFPSV